MSDLVIADRYGRVHAEDTSGAGGNAIERTGRFPRRARLVNTRSGAGGSLDKDLGTEYTTARLSRDQAETLYQMSWAAAKAVDIPVDDMFVRGRRITGDDEMAADTMMAADDELKVMTRLADALRAARIWGSSLLVICTDRNEDLTEPLNPEDVVEGSLRNLVVYDRWAASVETWVTDQSVAGFGDPYTYRISGRTFGNPDPSSLETGGRSTVPSPSRTAQTTTAYSHGVVSSNFVVHRDRLIRFDGIQSPLTEGWTSGPWEREWGVSILTRILDDLYREAASFGAVGHLMQQSSVFTMRFQGFKESLKGRPARDEPTAEELAEAQNELLSIYRILFMDRDDEAERVAVSWQGLSNVLNALSTRIAGIAGVPVTRWMGTSATGLSATGEGDARDWRIHVKALQAKMLDPVLRRLDMMIARHAGIAEPPSYEWIPLGELTPVEEAEMTHKLTEAVTSTYVEGLVDEDEARERLAKIEFWGELGDWTEPEATAMEREAQAAEMEALNAAQADPDDDDDDESPFGDDEDED